MKKHIKIYHKALGIPLSQDCQNERVSELGGGLGVDINHIECRGMGGSSEFDRIENLMAMTREQHIEFGDKKQHKAMMFERHRDFLINNGVVFDDEWIQKQIDKC